MHEGTEETNALEKKARTLALYPPHTNLNNTPPKGDSQGRNSDKAVCLWGLRSLDGFSGLRFLPQHISITVLLMF